MTTDKIHFELSERKMMLHFVDVICVLLALNVTGNFFRLEYLTLAVSNGVHLLLLLVYLKLIGAVFEFYNLQVASTEFQLIRSTILTVTTTTVTYFLTPVYSPPLPANRLQILAFFTVIFLSLILWRLFYVRFLASKRFYQNALLILVFFYSKQNKLWTYRLALFNLFSLLIYLVFLFNKAHLLIVLPLIVTSVYFLVQITLKNKKAIPIII